MKFVVRDYKSSDLDCVVSLWIRSYAWSNYGRERGAHVARSAARDQFWRDQEVTVHVLLERCTTKLLVSPIDENTIWAFACTSKGFVHFAVAKDRAGRGDESAPIPNVLRESFLRELLPLDDESIVVTHEIPDLRVCARKPKWRKDVQMLVPAIFGRLA